MVPKKPVTLTLDIERFVIQAMELHLLFDHLVLFVGNLTTASARFESKGFTVTPGDANGLTHNALIIFSNGTQIELISLQSPRTRLMMRSLRSVGLLILRRWRKRDLGTRLLDWMSGLPGLIDLCFRGAEITKISTSSPPSSIGLADPIQFKRHRPDESVVEWTFRDANDPRQPFFILDETPIDCRIPSDEARIQPNGALGISEGPTGELIESSVSNVRITHDYTLRPGSMSVTIVNELKVIDHIQGPNFFNADINLLSEPSYQQKT